MNTHAPGFIATPPFALIKCAHCHRTFIPGNDAVTEVPVGPKFPRGAFAHPYCQMRADS